MRASALGLCFLVYSFFAYSTSDWGDGANTDIPFFEFANEVTLVYNGSSEKLMAIGTAIAPPAPTYSAYTGGMWSTGANIPMGTSYGVRNDIYTAFNSSSGRIFAAWGDAVTTAPYFSIYNGAEGTWSTAQPMPLGESAGVYADVFLVYNPNANQIFAAWADSSSRAVYYSIYASSSWSTPATIPLDGSSGAVSDVFLAYDSDSTNVFAGWADQSSGVGYASIYNGNWTTGTIPMNSTTADSVTLAYYPHGTTHEMIAVWGNIGDIGIYFSTYSGGSWSTAAEIPRGASDGTHLPVLMAYDSHSQQLVAAWQNSGGPALYYSYYSTTGGVNSWATAGTMADFSSYSTNGPISLAYDSLSQLVYASWNNTNGGGSLITIATFDGSAWSTPTVIPLVPDPSDGLGSQADVIACYDSINNQVILTWPNGILEAPLFAPFSSAYNGTTWEAPIYIPMGESIAAYGVSAVYDSNLQQIFAAWGDFASGVPFYSTYTSSGWTTAQLIDITKSSAVQTAISLAYDNNAGQVIAAWGDFMSNDPTYSIYSDSDPMSEWSPIGTINQGTSHGVKQDVSLTYDAASHQVFAAWADSSDNSAYYSLYDGSSWSLMASTIPISPSSGVYFDVALAYDSGSEQVFAAWGDVITNGPYSSVYSGSEWSSMPTAIPLGGSIGVHNTPFLTYDPYQGQLFAAWKDTASDHVPYYSTYSAGSWAASAEPIPLGSSTGIITSFGTFDGTFALNYDPAIQQIIAAWIDANTDHIYGSSG